MNDSSGTTAIRALIAFLATLLIAELALLGAILYFLHREDAQTSHEPPPEPATLSVKFTPAPTAEPTPVPTAEPAPEPTAEPTPEPTPVPVALPETEDAGQEYIDKMVFLGDSSIYWLAGLDILPFTQVWTDSVGTMSLFNVPIDPIVYYDPASPGTTESLLIPECAARRQPEYLFITLGLNGIAMLDEEQFRGYYMDMLEAIQEASPDTKIILHAIMPVIDSRVPAGISNEKIKTANGWIYSMAEEMGLRYLDSHDALADENGQLRTDYTDDAAMGIHMNSTGLSALLMDIRTHAWL